jgi:hypothetical protein
MSIMLAIFGSRIKVMEIKALLSGRKPVVRQGFYDEEIPGVESFCNSNGLHMEVTKIKIEPTDSCKGFSNRGVSSDRGMRFVYISRQEMLSLRAHLAELRQDHEELGKLLGYPRCCVDFFCRNFDPASDLNMYFIKKILKASGGPYPFYTNILNRHKDYALISHFPCDFHCPLSIEIAKMNLTDIEDREAYAKHLVGNYWINEKHVKFK